MNLAKVSILICSYNRVNALKKCLTCIADLDYPKHLLELIILDDASTDETPQEIPRQLETLKHKLPPTALYFRNEKNLNIVASRYLLGKKISADSEWLFFLDDDVHLHAECLLALSKFISVNPRVGAIGPRIQFAKQPEKTAHMANFVNPWTAKYHSKDNDFALDCDWLIAACLLIRKSLWGEIGGFYPGYFTCHEEVEFCIRTKNLGFRVVYLPNALAYHDIDPTVHKRKSLYYLYRNKMLLVHRNFSHPRKISALSLIIFLGIPKYLFESVKFNKKPVFSELGLIFLSIWHGFLGKEGSLTRES